MRQLSYPSGFVYGSCLTLATNYVHTALDILWYDIPGMVTTPITAGSRVFFNITLYTGHNAGVARGARVSPFFTGTASDILYSKRMRVIGAATETTVLNLTTWQDISDRTAANTIFIWHSMIGMFTATSSGNFSTQIAKNNGASFNLITYAGSGMQVLPAEMV